MDFLYDKAKSRSNKEKHGIDFIEAQIIWEDPKYLEIQINANEESRFLITGRAYEKIWSAVVTYRKGSTRIISVRKARKNEVIIYES